ncbi:hypothetical protein GCM10010123_14160 [Pilimelia anulata]|uniref:Uncharacterized protein n=1 Tax=Pilimelia anulata TaxID=53371 RepID=A0A8J3F746_9ACTN|nr:hypothetical protein [Pilimelia anulata]GGJ85684.1 hypothetical protein GCM10010123_14160 [Pilimelia anulata]
MVVSSLGLILAAVVLFAFGAAQGSGPYFGASIAVSLLAGVALIAGVRQGVAPAGPAPRIPRPSRAPKPVTPGNLARLAAMSDTVHLTDGGASFHLPSCGDLGADGGRQVPVSAAVSAGLASCRWCRPAEALLRPVSRRL